MKTTTFISSIALGVTLFLGSNVLAQKFPDLDKSPMDMATFPNDHKSPTKTVKIIYSRPQLKGRSINDLAPNGKVWRTGANEATEITFYKDATLGKTKIKAGTYSLFTIPESGNLTIIISKDVNVWGAYTYKEANDVARLTVPISKGTESIEALSMVFTKADKGVNLNIGWGDLRVAVPFTE